MSDLRMSLEYSRTPVDIMLPNGRRVRAFMVGKTLAERDVEVILCELPDGSRRFSAIKQGANLVPAPQYNSLAERLTASPDRQRIDAGGIKGVTHAPPPYRGPEKPPTHVDPLDPEDVEGFLL